MEIKIKNRCNGWASGKCEDWLVNYDRTWDIEPDEDVVDCYANIIEVLENYKRG